MNLLRASYMGDAHKIVSVMKHSLERRQGKKWSLNSDQTGWLRNQIVTQINSSMNSEENTTHGRIVLAWAIKFAPEDLKIKKDAQEKQVRAEGSLKSNENFMIASTSKKSKEINSEFSLKPLKNKVLHMNLKNLSIRDSNFKESSNIYLDLKLIKSLKSWNSK